MENERGDGKMSSGGGLADTYFLFQLLGIPFTITNVVIYTGICILFFIIVVSVCTIISN